MLHFNREIQREVTTTMMPAETSKKQQYHNDTKKSTKMQMTANTKLSQRHRKRRKTFTETHYLKEKKHYYKRTQRNHTKILNNQSETQNDSKTNKNVHGKTTTRRCKVTTEKEKHKKKSNISTTKHITAPQRCPATKLRHRVTKKSQWANFYRCK